MVDLNAHIYQSVTNNHTNYIYYSCDVMIKMDTEL